MPLLSCIDTLSELTGNKLWRDLTSAKNIDEAVIEQLQADYPALPKLFPAFPRPLIRTDKSDRIASTNTP